VTLSIIIPAFDERLKISGDIEAAGRFLEVQHLAGEIIVVDDGSSDGTADTARSCPVPAGVPLRVIVSSRHRGKGHAVRTGILASVATYVMFADCGVTVPFEDALVGLRLLQEGQCELAHGSRRLPGSVIHKHQDWDRKLISRMFHRYVHRWMHIPVHLTDTQCGFKVYRGDSARVLYGECFTGGFMFDIEIILRAQRKGLRILEFPVSWACDRDSRISIFRSSTSVLKELLALRRALLRRS